MVKKLIDSVPNIYEDKKTNQTTTRIINNNLSYNKYIYNKTKYNNIIYYLLKNKIAYHNEIRNVFRIVLPIHYIRTLEDDNIIKSREADNNEKRKIKLLKPNTGNKYLDNLKVYELTDEALLFFSQIDNYKRIKEFANDEMIDNYIKEQHYEYSRAVIFEDERMIQQELLDKPKIKDCMKWLTTYIKEKDTTEEYVMEKCSRFDKNIIEKSLNILLDTNIIINVKGGYKRC